MHLPLNIELFTLFHALSLLIIYFILTSDKFKFIILLLIHYKIDFNYRVILNSSSLLIKNIMSLLN